MNNKDQSFFLAVEKGDKNTVEDYINKNPSYYINLKSVYNESALIAAVEKGHIEMVQWLLNQENIDLHIQGYLTGSALTYAVFKDQKKLAQLLLVNENKFLNQQHVGALNWAILNENQEIIYGMVKKGADVNSVGLSGYKEIPEWMLKPEPDPLSTPFHRESLPYLDDTPVCLATRCEKLELLNYFLSQCKATPNIPNNNGDLPLRIAIEKNNKSIVELLLHYGADPEIALKPKEHNQELPFFLQKPPLKISSDIQELLQKYKKEKNNPDEKIKPSFFQPVPMKKAEKLNKKLVNSIQQASISQLLKIQILVNEILSTKLEPLIHSQTNSPFKTTTNPN